MNSTPASKRTQVQRLPDRGKYDAETINAILDAAFVCHVGFVVDGQPFVIPTNYARDGQKLYLHGSSASRMLRTLAGGIPVCVTVTHVDGVVMARSAFHHSVNYRSVVALGTAVPVEDRDEKMHALELFTNHVAAGRWDEVRTPTDQELKGTSVLALDLAEASAKIRTGGPKDDVEDYALPIWAGVVPMRVVAGEPIADEKLTEGIPVAKSAVELSRKR
jgi:uncharacterized protein